MMEASIGIQVGTELEDANEEEAEDDRGDHRHWPADVDFN